MPHKSPSRAAFTTATVAAAIALLAGTIGLAAAARHAEGRVNLDSAAAAPIFKQLVPPPGAALLLIAGIVASRRGTR